ncbi:MAG: CinA family protein [Bacilli bacterium]|nr:CinA family protein [Bacilli bacterium]
MEKELKEIVKILTEKKETISTMESCTGGGLADKITNVSGSSEVFKFSAVTYCNEFKVKMGVSKDIIDVYSVYSIETAHEMARNISDFTNSNYGIGITGKLKKADSNNEEGSDNEVFVSIYESTSERYYDLDIFVTRENREDNKLEVIEKTIDKLLGILKTVS